MIRVVAATEADAGELSELLNAIIKRGGTTAHETPFSPESFDVQFLCGSDFVSCFKAMGEDGAALGFQGLGFSTHLPKGWGDIGTFTRLGTVQRGIGTALFVQTRSFAQARAIPTINATIRADNAGGIAYYSKLGFEDYNVLKAVPLKDGTEMDRICKRLDFSAKP